MWSKNGPITCQVVKIVHDDGNKQINNLKKIKIQYHKYFQMYFALLYHVLHVFIFKIMFFLIVDVFCNECSVTSIIFYDQTVCGRGDGDAVIMNPACECTRKAQSM